jgi:hypothetical protein
MSKENLLADYGEAKPKNKQIDEIKIVLVDGDQVRKQHSVEFTKGGTHYAPSYKFIPENEVWIEKNLSEKDFTATMVHELTERALLKFKIKKSYEKAHAVALGGDEILYGKKKPPKVNL